MLVDRLVDLFSRLLGSPNQERGQALAEYAIIITLVAVGATGLALITIRTQTIAAFEAVASCFTTFPCS